MNYKLFLTLLRYRRDRAEYDKALAREQRRQQALRNSSF